MDHHHPPPLPQQHGDHYRPLVLSPQPDHVHTLQYQQPQQQQQQATPPPQHHHPSLASHFHLLHMCIVPNIPETIRQLFLNSSNSIALVQAVDRSDIIVLTVEGQMQSLEETRQLLDQRKDLIAKYKSSVEDLLKGDPTR